MTSTVATAPGVAFGEGTLIGLEYEYRVLRDGEPVDFRRLVHDLRVDGRRVDPGDANAYRCRWGGVITADGREAEVAIPPVVCEPGFVDQITGFAGLAHRELRNVLPDDLSLSGYSTHLSVATPLPLSEPVATMFATRFSAPLMMMLDRRTSPGMLVRTRPGRTELCGEYASGPALRAASAFAVGGVLACARAVHDRRSRRTLPPKLDVRLEPVVERTGWYVDRAAFGVDLYEKGRGTTLRSGRRQLVAQRHLESAWAAARDAVLPFASAADLRDVDAMVDGSLRLAIDDDSPVGWPAQPSVDSLPDLGFGNAVVPRTRPFGTVEAVSVSWDLVVLALHGTRRCYLAIPRRDLAAALRRLDSGELDHWITDFVAASPSGCVLRTVLDVREPALYDDIESTRHLATDEPPPGAPHARRRGVGSVSGGGRSTDRPEKRRSDESSRLPRWIKPRMLVVGALVAAVAVAATAGAIVASGSDDGDTAESLTAPTGLPGESDASSGPGVAPLADPWELRELYYGDDHVVAVGVCATGQPGRVEAVSVDGPLIDTPAFGAAVPAGAMVFELTSVGSDRFEAITPPGAYNGAERTIGVRADCSGSTTGLSGPSMLEYGFLEWDIANLPITDQPSVLIVAPAQRPQCGAGGEVVDARLVWREDTDSGDFDDGALIGEEPFVPQPDGSWLAEVPTDRYIDELMVAGHSETTKYRCDYR